MNIQSSNLPTRFTSPRSYPLLEREKTPRLDTVDIDFGPRPSSIIAMIAGPTFGAAAARALGVSSPAGLVAAGLTACVAGYAFFSVVGDR